MTSDSESGAARRLLTRHEMSVEEDVEVRTSAGKASAAISGSMPIGVLLHDIARLRRQMFDAEMKPAGLTRSQSWVLVHLGRHEDSDLTQTEIADALSVGKVTLGGLIDRLEAHGLVRRELSATDRRIKYVRLTTKGRRALATTKIMRPLVDDLLMHGISPRLRDQLARALAIMRSNLLGRRRARRSTHKRGWDDAPMTL